MAPTRVKNSTFRLSRHYSHYSHDSYSPPKFRRKIKQNVAQHLKTTNNDLEYGKMQKIFVLKSKLQSGQMPDEGESRKYMVS